MKYSWCLVSSILVISFMLFFATEMDLVEAKTHEEKSKTYRRLCVDETGCNHACIFNEHFAGGHCRHLECFCFR
ncbi:unnamed protein product [Brassica oleracea var. botrytis]